MATSSPPVPPPPGKTRLIKRADDAPVFSLRQETDARTAITRGVREYLEQLSIDAAGGANLRFKRVRSTHAVPEEKAEYPSAVVTAPGEGTYDAARFTPQPTELPGGGALLQLSELALNVAVEVWAATPNERMWLVAMMEHAMNPVDFMYGCRLELPHYFGVRMTIEPKDISYNDSPDSAQRAIRVGTMTMACSVPVVRPTMLPRAVAPSFIVTVTEPSTVPSDPPVGTTDKPPGTVPSDFAAPGDGVSPVYVGQAEP